MKTTTYCHCQNPRFTVPAAFYLIILAVFSFFVMGCGDQNENLSKGKELIKSDKRRKEERAVREFYLAIHSEPTNPEANYLFGYYNSPSLYSPNRRSSWEKWLEINKINKSFEQLKLQSRPKERGAFLFKAYQENPGKYLEIFIFETLRVSSDELRESTLSALVQIYQSKYKSKLLSLIRKAIKSKDNRDRHDAQIVFSTIAKVNATYTLPIVEELKALLKHNRMETRLNAVKALGEIGNTEAISELVAVIDGRRPVQNWVQRFYLSNTRYQEEGEVRQLAVAALGQIGVEDPNSVAVDRLIEIVQNKGSALRVDAIEALGKIGNTDAVVPLIEILKEDTRRQIKINL